MVLQQEIKKVKVPQGVTVTVEGRTVKVKGPKGELSRTFPATDIELVQASDAVLVRHPAPRRRHKALIGTYASHIRNMVRGVETEFTYRLKILYSHFPIKAKVQGDTFVIENFVGEKTPRRAPIVPGTSVKVEGDIVVVASANVEAAGQTAANIESATKIRGFDTRVFQDGIYIIEKGA